MKTLNCEVACTMLRLAESSVTGQPLVEQVHEIIESCPNIVLDVEGIQFTSMLLGELANLAKKFEQIWEDRQHSICMTHVEPASQRVLTTVKFDRLIPIASSMDEAVQWVIHPKTSQRSAVH